MCSDFKVGLDDNVHILLASYAGMGYDGYAFVLFVEDDKLYEVHGSHCSCDGLEEQWEPEETSIVALQARAREGSVMACHGDHELEARDHLNTVIELLDSLPEEDAAERIAFVHELIRLGGRS
jgi:hypothetical protein